MLSVISISLEQGLILSILAIGVYITYKILDFPDLSVEGSFPAGAFVFAQLAIRGINPLLAMLAAGIFGSLIGYMTAKIFIKLKIKPILSGILTLTIMYSINLRVNAGSSNISLFEVGKILSSNKIINILALVGIVFLIKLLIDIFFKTEIGYLLLVTGDNEKLVTSLGQNANKYKTIGLMLANALVAMSGSLMAQSMGLADINMGTSIIVVALASIIIGDTIMKKSNLLKGTTRAIIGALVYKLIGAFAIHAGLAPNDLKAINAIIIIAFILYNNLGARSNIKNLLSESNLRNGFFNGIKDLFIAKKLRMSRGRDRC